MDIEEVRQQVFSSDEHKRFLKKQSNDKKKRESAMRIAAATQGAQGNAPQEEFSATLPNVLPTEENAVSEANHVVREIPPWLDGTLDGTSEEVSEEGTMQMSSPWTF